MWSAPPARSTFRSRRCFSGLARRQVRRLSDEARCQRRSVGTPPSLVVARGPTPAVRLENGIAVDSVGNADVAGLTCTDDFPVRRGFQSSRREGCDAFAAKLNPAGQGAEDSVVLAFLGSNGVDLATGIAVDALNTAVRHRCDYRRRFPDHRGRIPDFERRLQRRLRGHARHDTVGFKLVAVLHLPRRPLQRRRPLEPIACRGLRRQYLCQRDHDFRGLSNDTGCVPNLEASRYAEFRPFYPERFRDEVEARWHRHRRPRVLTFLGGNSREPRASQGERARGIAVGPNGDLYITGDTCSVDFPVTSDAFQASFAGPLLEAGARNPCDAFVVKLNPAGTGEADLVYASYFGGATEIPPAPLRWIPPGMPTSPAKQSPVTCQPPRTQSRRRSEAMSFPTRLWRRSRLGTSRCSQSPRSRLTSADWAHRRSRSARTASSMRQ